MRNKVEENQDRLATHNDYATTNFEPCITREEATKFGGEILKNHCISFRVAAVLLSKGKKELLDGLQGQDSESAAETYLETLEMLIETEKFIKVLADNNEKAICRLLCLVSSIIPEEAVSLAAE